MTKQLIQTENKHFWYNSPYFTLQEQDSDNQFYDVTAAYRTVEKVYLEEDHDMNNALVVSRTRCEFPNEHVAYYDIKTKTHNAYLEKAGRALGIKGLINEQSLWSHFLSTDAGKVWSRA